MTTANSMIIVFKSNEKNNMLKAIAKEADYIVQHPSIKNSDIINHNVDDNTITVRANFNKTDIECDEIHDVIAQEFDYSFIYNDMFMSLEVYDVITD